MASIRYSKKGGASLHRAAINSSFEELKSLLDSGCDVNSDFHGCTPLHCAVMVNFAVGVELLLDRGANINQRNATGDTPLHCAVWKRRSTIFEKLIARGADVNCQNKRGLAILLSHP
uniref:Ankyrin repeat domain-containing protein 54 n=1 Tax=Graphocephala atropunctata TaxID=36148 RepID=A0A1B6M3V3_9HEMI